MIAARVSFPRTRVSDAACNLFISQRTGVRAPSPPLFLSINRIMREFNIAQKFRIPDIIRVRVIPSDIGVIVNVCLCLRALARASTIASDRDRR